MSKPRNWHAVNAHQRNSAGPMGKRPDKGPSADEWERDAYYAWLGDSIDEERTSATMSLVWEEKMECEIRAAAYQEALDAYERLRNA